MTKEDSAALEALTISSALEIDVVRHIAALKAPLTWEATERVGKAVSQALAQAREPGSVVRISFDTLPELEIGSKAVRYMLTEVGFGSPPLKLKEEVNSAHFELTNNSAIMLGRKKCSTR